MEKFDQRDAYANLTSDIMLKLYANPSSDIPKLSEMPAVALEKFLNMNIYLSIQVNKREIDDQ